MNEKEIAHKKYLEKILSQTYAPKPDTTTHVTITGVRTVPSSSLAIQGKTDSAGLTEEAKEWLRQTSNIEKADDYFWSKKVKNSKELWNQDVPDSAFAADAKIVDHRQLAAKRPIQR